MILNSCGDEVLVDKLRNDGHPCKVPEWILPQEGNKSSTFEYSMYQIKAVSSDLESILYHLNGYYLYSRNDNSVSYIPLGEFIYSDPNIKSTHGSYKEFACPYSMNKYVFLVQFFAVDGKEYLHWYMYDHSTKTVTKVTPIEYREKGISIYDTTAPRSLFQWLSNSTEENDLLYTSKGVYCLQKNKIIDSTFSFPNIFSVSPNGKYKWHLYSENSGIQNQNTGYYLNGIEIIGIETMNSKLFFPSINNNIVWSPDSKFMSIIAYKDEEFSIAKSSKEMIIIDVEQSLLQRKIIRVKSVSFRDSYCAYRIGRQGLFLNDNKFAVSWSYNYDDKGIIYEIDLDSLDKKVLVDF